MIRKHFPAREKDPGDYYPEKGMDYGLYMPGTRESILVSLLCGSFAVGVAWLFYDQIFVALAFSVAAFPGLKMYCRYQAEKRRWQLRDQFRDLLYSLSASASSGRQLDSALKEAKGNLSLIYPPDAPICRELEIMVLEMEESKVPGDQVLENFARRSRIEEVQQFSGLCSLCRKTGGDMDRVIGKTADLLVEGIHLRRERRTLTAQKRMEAILLTLMPLMVLLFLRITALDYLSVMYETVQGRVVMSLALAALVGAWLWSLHLTGEKG